MTTIKSYTDINQSKKLAEILPIESADMCYGIDDDTLTYNDLPWLIPYHKYTAKEFYIPCWSLAALLELIPNWTMDKTDKVNLTCNPYYHCESCYEDPVDAAFEMICWLKENGKI